MGHLPNAISTDDKGPQKKKQFCRGCGIEGHKQDSCVKASLKFHNTGPMDYDKSPAWAEVLKEYPVALTSLGWISGLTINDTNQKMNLKGVVDS